MGDKMQQKERFSFDDAKRQALEVLPIALGIYHAAQGQYRLVLASDGLCDLLGDSRDVLIANFNKDHTYYTYVEDHGHLADAEMYAYLHPEEGFKGIYQTKGKKADLWLSADGKSEQQEDGSWLFYVIYTDVSSDHEVQARQSAEHQRTERLMQKILSTTKTSIFWKDAERRFLGANQAFLDYYGFRSVQDILGRTDEDMGWHSDPDPYKNDEWRILTQGISTVRVRGKCIAHGEERDIVASKSPLYEDGKIVGLVGSFEDVTEEYGQRARANQLRGILDHIPAGVAVYRVERENFICIAINGFLLNFLGLAADEVLGRSILEQERLYHPEDWGRVREGIAAFRKEQPVQQGVYRIRKSDTGAYAWFKLVGYYVLQSDGSALVYVSYTDISDAKAAEKAVQIARQVYENAADAADLVVWQYNIQEHRIELMDNAMTRAVCGRQGFPAIIENVPYSFLDQINKNDVPEFLAMYRAVENGRNASCEIRQRGKDGTMRYDRISYSVICDDDGIPAIAYGIGRNITQEKKQEQLYQRTLAQLNNVTGPDVIAKGHYDLTENRILEYEGVNSKALPLTVHMEYDLVRRDMVALVIDSANKQMLADILDRHTLIEKYQMGEQSFSVEYYRKNDGMPPVLVKTDVSTFAVEDNHVECFVITYDMTQKLLERSIINNLTEFGYEYIGMIDIRERTLTFYSPRLGVVESTPDNPLFYDEEIQERVSCFVPDSERGELYKVLQLDNILKELQEKQVFEYSYNYVDLHNPGDLLRKKVQFCYLTPAKQTLFMTSGDITQQYRHDTEQMQKLHQAVQAAEKANEARSMFLSSVSHDMRTPLNGILGFTNFALQTDDWDKMKDYLKKIKLSSSLLLSLINDTLELSRIESGKVEVNEEIVDSSDLLESIVVGVRVTATEKNVGFTAAFGSDFPKYVCADKLKVQEICLNLLSNAIKFTPSGGHVKFIVYWMPNRPHGMSCKIIVQDNGIGIGEDFQKRMFEAFSQEHAPESKNTMGTGLGLSIVKRYVGLLGGTIEVQSERGRGTSFTICLPLEIAQSAGMDEKESYVSVNLAGQRVLLCEDNYLNREIAATLLQEKNMVVTLANDGKEGVELFSQSPPHTFALILMDLRMPVMDGYEAAKAIRALPREDADIPIIAMTADAYEEDVQRCIQAGMNGHIVKPVDPKRLFMELDRWCKNR